MLKSCGSAEVEQLSLELRKHTQFFCYLFRVFKKASKSPSSVVCPLHIHSMMQPLPEVNDISQTLQVDFDRILCNVLEKYCSFPGFNLLLGSLLHFAMNIKRRPIFPSGMLASVYLIRQRGGGHILDDIGFSCICGIAIIMQSTPKFLIYFAQLLENPEQSGTQVFDQQRYTAAAKDCLQLCLFNHRNFSKGIMDSGHRDRALRRSKPSAWIARMGVCSRIWKGRHNFQILLKARITINQYHSFPEKSPQHECYRSLSYRWALDLLPFFLENSAISLELAAVLRRRTFTTMALQFPRRKRLAKEAIAKYLLQVESAAGNP